MEIIVNGRATKKFRPEKIIINMNFTNKENTYEKCLESGAKMVDTFIKEVLANLNIEKDELKTDRIYISESTRYIPEKSKRVFDGYNYSQTARITIDFDMKVFSKFMSLVSELKLPPTYRTSFGVNNEDEKRREVITEAISMAKAKAEAIRKATDKTTLELLKVDFKPFETSFVTNSTIDSSDFMYETANAKFGVQRSMAMSSSEIIENNFTPDDISLSETVYCLYIAK